MSESSITPPENLEQETSTEIEIADPKTPIHIVPRELSWLSFNERVLQEAADPTTPLIERMRFLGIFSNNMDEFFRVRVADVRRRILFPHLPTECSDEEVNDKDLLQDIQEKVVVLNKHFDKVFKQVNKELKANNITILNDHTQMTPEQSDWMRSYFRQEVLPHICPILIHRDMELSAQLNDDDFYLAVEMDGPNGLQYAVIEVPTKDTTRFILLPDKKRKHQFILLDDAIKHCVDIIFSSAFSYDSITAYSFKMTRDAELDLTDEIEQSLLDKLSKGLRRRLQAEPVRLVYDQDMPESLQLFLTKRLKFTSHDSLLPGGPYRNFRDFIRFPDIGPAKLQHKSLPSIPSQAFENSINSLDAIAREDILLLYPYHSFSYFTELLRQAAFDPRVKRIAINIYRLAKNSKVLNSLLDAARNGKQVNVVVELRARFDEQNNIELSRQLQAGGIRVSFGIPNLKIHSKLCLIERQEGSELKRYAHIGTGNFHEGNAKIYTDFSLFTAHEGITHEVSQVFDFINHTYRRFEFEHLIVSPLNSRDLMEELIRNEIQNAEQGKPAYMHIKVNNLCDNASARQLCLAAQSGVEVKLIVRGMCSLQTGDKGISDNIEVRSIVDRFLEHARILIFANGGDPKVFITSADLMKRNIDHRVEVGVPIYDARLRKQIIDIFDLQMKDNCKARMIDKKQSNPYVSDGRNRKRRSQIAIHQYLGKIESIPREPDLN